MTDRRILKQVQIPNPESVQIGDEVDSKRVAANGVVIHAGCKLFGAKTLICQGAQLGFEAPVTLKNCHVGPGVKLKGGYFENAVFLEGAEAGSGAHVRGGTIFEEQASMAHTVGLKQTILFPYVTLGSLINFCDCLMAGGTSRSDHSEVGSSYIHFNYTPNQDKATPSLLGDVPRGVMLNQRPIFLGGQGGLVGPSRIAFGTVIAAGSIFRKDQLQPDRLVFEKAGRGGAMPYTLGLYRNVKRIVVNNLLYISNLMALDKWYTLVRREFVGEHLPQLLYEGLVATLRDGIAERVRQLQKLRDKMPASIEIYTGMLKNDPSHPTLVQQRELFERWADFKEQLEAAMPFTGSPELKDAFLKVISAKIDSHCKNYLAAIQSISQRDADRGSAWLAGIVDFAMARFFETLPSFR